MWLVSFGSTFLGKQFGRKLAVTSYDQLMINYLCAVLGLTIWNVGGGEEYEDEGSHDCMCIIICAINM